MKKKTIRMTVSLLGLTLLASCSSSGNSSSVSSSPSSVKDTSGSTTGTTKTSSSKTDPVQNYSRTGNIKLDYSISDWLSHSLDANAEYDYSNSDDADYLFSISPLYQSNSDENVDQITSKTQENYAALNSFFSIDTVLHLIESFGIDTSYELPVAYTMLGNHLSKYVKATEFPDEHMVYSKIGDKTSYFDYSKVDDSNIYHAFVQNDVSENNDITSFINNLKTILFNVDFSKMNLDPIDTTKFLFQLLDITFFQLADYRDKTSVLGQAMDIIGSGTDASVTQDENGHYVYQASLNEKGVSLANQYFSDNENIPEMMNVAFASSEKGVSPLKLKMEFAKDKENETYLSDLDFAFSLNASLPDFGLSLPMNLNLNLTFEEDKKGLNQDYFTSYQNQLKTAKTDFETASQYYSLAKNYCEESTTDVTKKGENDFTSFLSAYDAYSGNIKKILDDSVSVTKAGDKVKTFDVLYYKTPSILDIISALTAEKKNLSSVFTREKKDISSSMETARKALNDFLNEFSRRADHSFRDSDFTASLLGKNSSFLTLAQYQNYEKAIQESENGDNVLSAWKQYISDYCKKKNDFISSCQTQVSNLNANPNSENAKGLVDSYSESMSSPLLKEKYVSSDSLSEYQKMEKGYQNIKGTALTAYSDYLVFMVNSENLTIDNLYSELNQNYETIVSDVSSISSLIGINTPQVDSSRQKALIRNVSKAREKLVSILQSEAESQYNSYLTQLKTLVNGTGTKAKDDWKTGLTEEIDRIDTIEEDMLGTSQTYSSKLDHLLETGSDLLK